MSFTFSDFGEFKQLLLQHPEWCAELRNLLLAEDFQALPGIVRELAEAQRASEQRLTRLEEAVAELQKAVAELQRAVAELVDAQRRTEQRLDRIEIKLAQLDGRTLEHLYQRKAAAYLGRWLRRTKVIEANDLVDRLEAHLSAPELHEVLLTDLVVCGRVLADPARPEVWLAIEISSLVDHEDVVRAVRRAELLRRGGLSAVPAVAGAELTPFADTESRDRGVFVLRDGSGSLWDEALAAWLR